MGAPAQAALMRALSRDQRGRVRRAARLNALRSGRVEYAVDMDGQHYVVYTPTQAKLTIRRVIATLTEMAPDAFGYLRDGPKAGAGSALRRFCKY